MFYSDYTFGYELPPPGPPKPAQPVSGGEQPPIEPAQTSEGPAPQSQVRTWQPR